MSILARLKDLRVYFYDSRDRRFIRAVENMSFSIERGGVLGLVGESGCGKTVTALSMMGLITSEPGLIGGEFYFMPKEEDRVEIETNLLKLSRKVSGSYLDDGRMNLFYGLSKFLNMEKNPFTIIKDSEKWLRYHDRVMERIRGKNISIIFQNPASSLNPFLTIEKQIYRTFKKYLSPVRSYELRDRALELLRSVRIYNPEAVLKMYPSSLSMGMAQRVIIALSLISSPRLLIADEPTTGLDTTNKYRIINLLKTIIEERRLSMLLISHNIRIVGEIASNIAVMYAGILVELGTKNDILRMKRGPKHPYTEALLQAIPTDSDIKKGKKLRVIGGRAPNNKLEIRGCPFFDRCSYVVSGIKKLCSSELPPLIEVAEGHLIRCHIFSK